VKITAWADPQPGPSSYRLAWIAAGDEGHPIGTAHLRLFTVEGAEHRAEAEISVHPAERRHGAGSALLAEAVSAARSAGRRTLVAGPVEAGSPGESFLVARGLRPVLALTYARLALRDAEVPAESPPGHRAAEVAAESPPGHRDPEVGAESPPGHRDAEVAAESPPGHRDAEVAAESPPGHRDAEVGAESPPGYRLVMWEGIVPDELALTFADSRRAMDDMPMDEADVGAESWDVDRVRSIAAAIAERGDILCTVAAVDEADGTIAGFSELVVPGGGTTDAQHYGTGVLPEHRGRGLARWMKAAAIRHTQEHHPDVPGLLTDTADSNATMRRINDTLGYAPTHRSLLFQLDLRPPA
jgi:GNAT superfamily N-acetyltransferase